MSEHDHADRQPPSLAGPPFSSLASPSKLPGQTTDAGPHVAIPATDHGDTARGRRVDPSHTVRPAGPSESDARDEPALDDDPATDQALVPRTTAFTIRDEDLLLQASQIAEHLRTQFADLDRRERALGEQLSLLDQERRRVRLWVHQFEEEMFERAGALKERETKLADKLSACEGLVRELEEQERVMLSARDQLSAERAALQRTAARDLEVERQSLRQTQRVLETERRQLAEEFDRLAAEQESALDATRKELDRQREQMQAKLSVDLDAQQREFERERAEWASEQTAQLDEIRREREILQTAIQRSEQELSALRDRQLAEIERQKLDQERRLEEQRQEIDRDHARQLAEIAAARADLSADIERERAESESLLSESGAKLDEDRTALEREKHLFENRMRFQQEHLQKARLELESDRREFRQELQQSLARLEHDETASRLRAAQLDHFRAVLDERELSIARERELLSASLAERRQELDADRERLRREHETWEQERATHRAEMRRQQDLLTFHADHLENRRNRLDQLRAELEETHRNTLEMRLSVEDTWAQLASGPDQESIRARVHETRALLAENQRQEREKLAREQRESSESLAELRRQRDEFRGERQTLTDWVQERDEQLRVREERLRRDTESLETREAAWRTLRDQWLKEKMDAEQIIRGLLAQLAERTEPLSSESEFSGVCRATCASK